jgi:hypothetical protein
MVNQHWFDVGDQGIVWGVTAVPIAPTETITLTIGDAYYHGPPTSNFSLPLPPDGTIYAQVDSVNLSTNYGGVLEDHELNNGPYNNIISSTVTAGPTLIAPATSNQNSGAAGDKLPQR